MSGPVIEAERLVKHFKIPHEKRATLFEKVVGKLTRGDLFYEDFRAVDGVSFSVGAGESLALIGANGSGKTTLLRILAGILRPTSGSLRVRGRIVPLLELGIGIHLDLTGLENIYLYGAILGMTRAEVKRRLDAIVEFSGVGRFLETPLKHYSSGMKLRLVFATAAQARGDVYLFDEVLAVGDDAFQKKCHEKIRDLQRAGGTILLVSHAMGTVREFSQRAIWMERGRIREDGAPAEVTKNYITGCARLSPTTA